MAILYRFLPNSPQTTARYGGQLQTLHVKGQPGCDTRNWEKILIEPGSTVDVEWKNIDHPESPDDDLRHRGVAAGAACFARGEGMWRGHRGEIYFACTSGGSCKKGQIWRYTPSPKEGTPDERQQCGKLELFIESQGGGLVQDADNLTVAPWGDLIVCEDRVTDVVRLMGVTPDGRQYPFAMNHTNGELAGVCFSPDGSTLFVNIQKRGLTLAVTGTMAASSGELAELTPASQKDVAEVVKTFGGARVNARVLLTIQASRRVTPVLKRSKSVLPWNPRKS